MDVIGNDCINIIMGYKDQLEHVDKFKKCLDIISRMKYAATSEINLGMAIVSKRINNTLDIHIAICNACGNFKKGYCCITNDNLNTVFVDHHGFSYLIYSRLHIEKDNIQHLENNATSYLRDQTYSEILYKNKEISLRYDRE